jgi:hypothetical protein
MYTILVSFFFDFRTWCEYVTANVSSFGDENETNHNQVLRKLMNKLTDYLKMHWAVHAEQHQSRKPKLNVLLDWVNRQNYIASKINLGVTKQIKHIDNRKHREASTNRTMKNLDLPTQKIDVDVIHTLKRPNWRV